jgi:hypothetical protein
LVPLAHAGRPLFGDKVFVAKKMCREVETIARTIRLQLKLTPRRQTFASLTLVLIFCQGISIYSKALLDVRSYQVLGLLLFC